MNPKSYNQSNLLNLEIKLLSNKASIPQLFLFVVHGLLDRDNNHFLYIHNKQDVRQLYLYWQASPQINSLHLDIPEKEIKVVSIKLLWW